MPEPIKSRYIGFFPALPLEKNIQFGQWEIGCPPPGTQWANERFRSLASSIVELFGTSGFKNSAMLWHRESGFDGDLFSDDVVFAIQTSVRFSALDSNDFTEGDPNRAHVLVTSENAQLFIQPIDDHSNSIAYRRGGSLKSTLVYGFKADQQVLPLPDATMELMRPARISQRLTQAVYDHVLATSDKPSHIRTAMEWHASALANPVAVTMQQRIIAIKTGFEALLGSSASNVCAQRLRKLFETTTEGYKHLLPWRGILWSPTEKTNLQRHYVNRKRVSIDVVRSELEDWFMTLADARNSIIHDGVLSVVKFAAPTERPLSRYSGWLFWNGERLLREAIKASLGAEILLCGLLGEQEKRRALGRALREAVAHLPERTIDSESYNEHQPTDMGMPASADASVTKSPEPEPRTLAQLLAELRCTAANRVEVEMLYGKAHGHAGASYEGVEILVSLVERDILVAAGAEAKLAEVYWSCD